MTELRAPRRVVLDTDTANEIDDQFALAWALLADDRIQLEGIHAAPFSHGIYFQRLAEACAQRGSADSRFERIASALEPASLQKLIENTSPADGMQRSYHEIERVLEAAGIAPGTRVRRGAPRFMPTPDTPVDSEAVRHLIELAATATAGNRLDVAIIGAPTNVASALLLEPSIAEHMRVIFLAGFPSGAGVPDDSFNLVQDRFASNVLFESPVPLVYLPGYQVAELLQMSRPDVTAWVKGQGALGDYLFEAYRHNPINPDGLEPGHSWVLWDMIATAFLIEPEWVPHRAVPRARVGEGHCWEKLTAPGRRPSAGAAAAAGWAEMDEAYRVDRNAVFGDFLTRLGAHAPG